MEKEIKKRKCKICKQEFETYIKYAKRCDNCRKKTGMYRNHLDRLPELERHRLIILKSKERKHEIPRRDTK